MEAVEAGFTLDNVRVDRSFPLGTGNFGAVYRARTRDSEQRVAVKIISSPELLHSVRSEALMKEAGIDHPNIMKIYDTRVDDGLGLGQILMERLDPRTVEDFVDEELIVRRSTVNFIFLETLKAVRALHVANIAHCDIKASNISYCPERRTVKLFDFGLAVKAPRLPYHPSIKPGAGSPIFFPPEVFSATLICPFAQDIWSLGMLLYFLLAGEDYFNNARSMSTLRHRLECKPIVLPTYFPENYRNLLFQLLTKDPSKRPVIEEVYDAFTENQPTEIPSETR